MTAPDESAATPNRTLHFTRLIDAPREAVYRAWTEPELLMQWFCPLPWKVTSAELDIRPGGAKRITMAGPEGETIEMRGVYLEVDENRRLVFTDAFTEAWLPSDRAFMTITVTFDDEGGKTRYSARAQHWSEADREEHEAMGFYGGWGIAADQLEALLAAP